MAVLVEGGVGGRFSGRVGNAVLVETPQGTVLRELPRRTARKSALQIGSEARLAAASRAFRALTREEGRAWAAFAAALAAPDRRTGRGVAPSAQQAFNRLATKLLQIDPQTNLPRLPPLTPFFGDGVRVTVAPLPQPPLQDEPRDEGALTFLADAPNREGVLTELRLQPLLSAHRRTYPERYRTRAFVAFAEGSLAQELAVAPGWWASAVRFVEAATGRATPLMELEPTLVV